MPSKIGKVYADPNSSKRFAEYDDATAEEETQKMLEEQKQEVQATQGKSTNNYLDNLQIEGYELSTEFNKQTVDYVLKEKYSIYNISSYSCIYCNNDFMQKEKSQKE